VNPNQPAATRSGRSLTYALSDVVVAGAAFLFFVFSFTPVVSVSAFGASATRSLWQFDSPLGWWTAIANLLVLATAALAPWWLADREYFGFSRSQVQVVIALFVFVEIFGTLIFLGSIFGWGGYLMFICSIAALAGAVLGHIGQLQNPIAIPGIGGGGSKHTAYEPTSTYQSSSYQPPAPSGGYESPSSYQTQQTGDQPRQD